eukprot:TRINITY_DN16517_c0_g1_i1.p1 TRINITY_DN16517_c0_g1~~TRINITY_DN16517_c0_g1_i1.p1  ORF type:complete len:439 (+),score=32.67 TRINITY_DN16517_c0_g1_i1:82-1317(+)
MPIWPFVTVYLAFTVMLKAPGHAGIILSTVSVYFATHLPIVECCSRGVVMLLLVVPMFLKIEVDKSCPNGGPGTPLTDPSDCDDEEDDEDMRRYPSLTNLKKKIRIASDTPGDCSLQSEEINRELDSEWCVSRKVLGRGGFGEVMLGVSSRDCRFVAIKTQFLTNYTPPSSRRRGRRNTIEEKINLFINEVTLLSMLRHENVVAYLGSGVSGHHLYVVLEYMSGGTLADVIEKFPKLPLACLKKYVADITTGLSFLHGKGVIHRDLKPVNILLNAEGKCKLADFGAATSVITQAQPAGTPFYMSPEACAGHATSASDVWSLGIITYQLFTSTLPFSTTIMAFPEVFNYKLQNHKEDALPDVGDSLDTATPGVRSFVSSCLSVHPEDRPTADKLLAHPLLECVYKGCSGSSS